jgi:DNA-binding LacI/PurR family transcriptional regulator
VRIDHAASTPLYQQVATDIRRRIVSGEMPVGMQLPPHRELATRYGVSGITINKALSGLVSEGILNSRVGRGTFVARRPSGREARPERNLGFVLRDLSSPFFSLVAHAAQQRADELGCGLFFSSSSNRLDREEEQIQRFRDLHIAGLIVVSMSRTYRVTPTIQRLQDEGVPYVMVSYTHGEDVPFIGVDLERAGYIATEHLIRAGRRRIAYAGDRFGSILYEVRSGGYRRALAEHGLPSGGDLEFEYPFEGEWNDYRSGHAIGERIAASASPPDGMFVFNDLGALGVMDALLERGVRVPEDIAIVGLDDIELAGRARVPLTTVRQPADQIGAAAVDFVLARLAGEQPPLRRLFEPHLVVRQSSGAPVSAWPPPADPPSATATFRGTVPQFTLQSGESR